MSFELLVHMCYKIIFWCMITFSLVLCACFLASPSFTFLSIYVAFHLFFFLCWLAGMVSVLVLGRTMLASIQQKKKMVNHSIPEPLRRMYYVEMEYSPDRVHLSIFPYCRQNKLLTWRACTNWMNLKFWDTYKEATLTGFSIEVSIRCLTAMRFSLLATKFWIPPSVSKVKELLSEIDA